ncbi:MAG: CPBP family intramembrane glutamic endopeptidase [Ignavibacteria bacterium]
MDSTENRNENSRIKAPLANMQPALFVVLSLMVVFISYQIFGGLLSLFIYGDDLKTLDTDVNTARIIISFSQFMFILVPVLLLNMLQGTRPKETFRLNKPKQSVFWLGIAGMVVVQPAIQSFMYLQNLLLKSLPFGGEAIKQIKELMDALEAVTLNLVNAHSIGEFVLVAFVIAVTPAICEEFFFRGLVFHNFERTMISSKAVFLTGFIFAVFHFHPFNLIPLILLGYYLTYVVYYSSSILTGIAVHFVNNFLSAYLVFRYGKEGFENPEGTIYDNMPLIVTGIISFVLFIIILFFIKNKGTENKDKIVIDV